RRGARPGPGPPPRGPGRHARSGHRAFRRPPHRPLGVRAGGGPPPAGRAGGPGPGPRPRRARGADRILPAPADRGLSPEEALADPETLAALDRLEPPELGGEMFATSLAVYLDERPLGR